MVCSFKEKERQFQQKLDFSGRKIIIIYKNAFYYAIISIFQAFTVWQLENETFKQSESHAFMLQEKENRDSNLLTTYGCRKRTGKRKKKANQQRMKSKPWVIAEGILLSCMPQFSILLLLPPVLFTLVPPEVLPAAIGNKTFLFWRGDSIGEHGLEKPTPCWHTWEDPELIKTNNNNTIFSQRSKQPWQNFFQVWQGLTWIHFFHGYCDASWLN